MIKKILFTIFIFVTIIGFSQEKTVADLVASPNPFSNYTTISFDTKTSQTVTITIKNVLGKVVYSNEISAKAGKNNTPFHRNNLKSGMYIYTIQTKKDFISKRFVIK